MGHETDFDFEEDDTVLVRIRNGVNGSLRAKFVADVNRFYGHRGPGSSFVSLDPPWDSIGDVRLHAHEAEFEVVEDGSEVQF